jgi:hypothetical protein
MHGILVSEVQKGKLRPNWSKYIGEVNSILNQNDVSVYETGFGIDFYPIMTDNRDSICSCTIIQ